MITGSSPMASRMWRRRRGDMLQMANDGMTYQEIANQYGIAAGTVSQLLRKARQETKIRMYWKTVGRIDATQPDDAPRGVWLEK